MQIKSFNDLVGNPLVISLLEKGLANKSLPQFVLLSGVCGIGKSSIAELMALALTCENPNRSAACGECETCRRNQLALGAGGGGKSPQMEKVNMALVSKNNSVREVIKSTFQIMRTGENHVKIFEEFHSLKEEEQRLFLEETARMPQNVFVILTTTHCEYILEEMVSRCLTFSFGRLSKGESAVLVDKINTRLRLRPEDYRLIWQKTGGIPRNIVLLVEFLSANNPSTEEIDAMLGNIGKEVFFDLFDNVDSFRIYMELVDDLLHAYSFEFVLEKLSEFLVQLVFALEGEIFDFYPKKLVSKFPAKGAETIYKMLKVVEGTKPDEHCVKLMFMRIRRIVAPPASLDEQKAVAEIAQSVKNSLTPITHKLTKFK